MPLDELLDGYRRGAELLNYCRGRLQAVEEQRHRRLVGEFADADPQLGEVRLGLAERQVEVVLDDGGLERLVVALGQRTDVAGRENQIEIGVQRRADQLAQGELADQPAFTDWLSSTSTALTKPGIFGATSV